MEFIGGFLDALGSINWEALIQLVLVAGIMISGPVVIFLLYARGGDL
jgi:hypothetical protein